MLEILLIVSSFSIGVLFGYIVRVFLAHRMRRSGTILVTKTEDKKIFSLVLDGDPEDLENQDEVMFKVRAAYSSD
jgi:hypothetical protein